MQQHCDKRYVRHALEVLRAAGCRHTRPRTLVLEELACRSQPASPYDLQKELQERGERVDHVTIYRTIELLERLNLAHRVLSVGGYVRCVLGEEHGCHGYLVCRRCGGLQEFADEGLCLKEDEVAGKLGFRAERHVSEFTGLCSVCHE